MMQQYFRCEIQKKKIVSLDNEIYRKCGLILIRFQLVHERKSG